MFIIKTLFIYRTGWEGKGQMIASGLDFPGADLYLSAVLYNLSQTVDAIVPILRSSLCSHVIWESRCDLQAYITPRVSQHAHGEGSMVQWKEHGIWCQRESSAPASVTS